MRRQLAIQWRLIAIIVIWVGLVSLFLCAYLFQWDWTGFIAAKSQTVAETTNVSPNRSVTITQTMVPAKTIWDWMNFIVVGFAAIIATLLAGIISDRQKKTDLEIASDKQREDALQSYIDKMSELLLKEHLGERTADGKLNPKYDQVCKVARVRTITVLTQLDARRIGYVFTFLREAELMSVTKDDNAISLKNADLQAVDWSQADLRGADLRGANLRGANLSGAIFFSRIYVPRAFGGTLAIPNGADLSGADLSGANLRGAKVSDEQLAKAASLAGATMLDGSIHS